MKKALFGIQIALLGLCGIANGLEIFNPTGGDERVFELKNAVTGDTVKTIAIGESLKLDDNDTTIYYIHDSKAGATNRHYIQLTERPSVDYTLPATTVFRPCDISEHVSVITIGTASNRCIVSRK